MSRAEHLPVCVSCTSRFPSPLFLKDLAFPFLPARHTHLCLEAIERLAGGRLDVLEGDQDDHNDKETFSESEVMTVSLDDEDEYTTMLDSIPLNTTTPTPEANQQVSYPLFAIITSVGAIGRGRRHSRLISRSSVLRDSGSG